PEAAAPSGAGAAAAAPASGEAAAAPGRASTGPLSEDASAPDTPAGAPGPTPADRAADDDTDPGPAALAGPAAAGSRPGARPDAGPGAPRVRVVSAPASSPRSPRPGPAPTPAQPVTPRPRPGGTAGGASADPLALRSAALESLHRRTVRRVKRGLGELETTTLDRVRRVGGQGEAEALLPLDEELGMLSEPAAEQLHGAYAAGVDAAATLVGRPLPSPRGERDLEEPLRSDASRRIRNGLLGSLREGIDAGEDLDALADRVR